MTQSEPKAIQVRNVPADVHQKLRVRAAQEGLSLSEYILRQITQLARQPTLAEVMERIRQREPVNPNLDVVGALRAERDSNDR
jgi:antitoxin FitA